MIDLRYTIEWVDCDKKNFTCTKLNHYTFRSKTQLDKILGVMVVSSLDIQYFFVSSSNNSYFRRISLYQSVFRSLELDFSQYLPHILLLSQYSIRCFPLLTTLRRCLRRRGASRGALGGTARTLRYGFVRQRLQRIDLTCVCWKWNAALLAPKPAGIVRSVARSEKSPL